MTDYALKSENYGFTEVSRGEGTLFEMRGLSPNTTQNFRVAAANSVGLSAWSSLLTCCTPAAVPAAPAAPQLVHVGHTSAVIRWSPPLTDGGARVERYIIDVSTSKGTTGLSLIKVTLVRINRKNVFVKSAPMTILDDCGKSIII